MPRERPKKKQKDKKKKKLSIKYHTSYCDFNLHYLMANDVKHHFMCLFVTHITSLVNCLFRSSAHFLVDFLFPYCQVLKLFISSSYKNFVKYMVCKFLLLVRNLSFNAFKRVFCDKNFKFWWSPLYQSFLLWSMPLLSCLRTPHIDLDPGDFSPLFSYKCFKNFTF